MAFSDDLTTAILPLVPGNMILRRISDSGVSGVVVWVGPLGECLRVLTRETKTCVTKPDKTREVWSNKYADADVQTILGKNRGDTGF